MMRESLLEAKAISLVYESGREALTVLRSINLELAQGDAAAIIGTSGSGKSSLLHVLGGLLAPTEGEVLLNGERLSHASADERARIRNQSIGFVYQFHHLLPEFTALENVAMPMLIAGNSTATAWDHAELLLQQVGLAHRLSHRPSALSGGERQRVAIARALANSPDCILADEPTGNLDSRSAAQVMELLLEINQTRKTSLMVVTHDQNWAECLSIGYRMQDGQLIEGK